MRCAQCMLSLNAIAMGSAGYSIPEILRALLSEQKSTRRRGRPDGCWTGTGCGLLRAGVGEEEEETVGGGGNNPTDIP